MDLILLPALAFAAVIGIVLAIGWGLLSGGAVRERLATAPPVMATPTLLRPTGDDRYPLFAKIAAALPVGRGVNRLLARAGWEGRSGEFLAMVVLLACAGGVLGAVRTGNSLWGVVCAASGACVPVVYLRIRGQKRMDKFAEQFPEALDMMTRAIRAGYALGPAIQLVGEEMPDPVGPEFRRVFEEISLGGSPGEAVLRMCDRIEGEDIRFFYACVSIQRDVGGNMAEILEKLSQVIRERFKLLSYARVLSAQQKASAYFVAASPFIFAILLSLVSPGWFDPLWRWPHWQLLVLAGLTMEVIGFIVIRRIANITY